MKYLVFIIGMFIIYDEMYGNKLVSRGIKRFVKECKNILNGF